MSKLFIHDEKHEQVIGELDLGEITKKEEILIGKIIKFLADNELTDRYKRLVLAEDFKRIYENKDIFEVEDPEIEFTY